MEAVPHSTASTPITAAPHGGRVAPKLTIEKFADGGITCLKFTGTIDETFEGKKLGAIDRVRHARARSRRREEDLVVRYSRVGRLRHSPRSKCRSLVLIECAPKVVDQLNMVANFAGGGRVFSFYAPFRCDYCDSEHRVLLEVSKDFEVDQVDEARRASVPVVQGEHVLRRRRLDVLLVPARPGPVRARCPTSSRFLASQARLPRRRDRRASSASTRSSRAASPTCGSPAISTTRSRARSSPRVSKAR